MDASGKDPLSQEPSFAGLKPDFPLPQRPRRTPWTFRDLLLFILFVVIALVVLSFVSFSLFALLGPFLGWKASPEAMRHNIFLALGFQFILYVFIFSYVYVLVVHRYGLRFGEGIQWGAISVREVSYYVVAGILMTVAVQLAPTLLPDKTKFPLERLFSSPASAYAMAIFAVVIAPFMEELIFRGFLFSVFELRVGLSSAIVVTAILFAGMHAFEYQGAWNHLLLIFVVGFILSLARGLTHKLAPSVVMHTTYNACLMIALFVATSHFHSMHGLVIW